jgi:hypothetical protein
VHAQSARQRTHDVAHARRADQPVVDRFVELPLVFDDPRSPGVSGLRLDRLLDVLDEWPAARSEKLRAMIERELAGPPGGQSSAQPA